MCNARKDDYSFVCRMDLSVACVRDSKNDTLQKRFQQSWPIADYYVKLPWPWVRHMAKSLIRLDNGGAGHLFAFQTVRSPPIERLANGLASGCVRLLVPIQVHFRQIFY